MILFLFIYQFNHQHCCCRVLIPEQSQECARLTIFFFFCNIIFFPFELI
jgi:hypothetical protein